MNLINFYGLPKFGTAMQLFALPKARVLTYSIKKLPQDFIYIPTIFQVVAIFNSSSSDFDCSVDKTPIKLPSSRKRLVMARVSMSAAKFPKRRETK